MPRLRSLSHLGFQWQFDRDKLILWHSFIKLFEVHLRDTDTMDTFYYDLLMKAAKKWEKQNPKRIICESYIELLLSEGRLYIDDHCYICEQKIDEVISLMQTFKPAHPSCINSPYLPTKKVFDFFSTQKTVFLEDYEVDYLYEIVKKGF